MNKNISKLLYPAALLALVSCSQELPFDGEGAEGYLNRDAMGVEFKNSDLISGTRASDVNMDDFRVEIRNKSNNELVKAYRYAEMPEVVALPVGDYTVDAIYGENHPNKWENPYYLGDTDFSIEAGKITEDLEPVVCKLSNIRIKVQFGPVLAQKMSADSKVEVKVGQTGSLDFTKGEERAGYFAYTPGSQTITATFNGTIDGDQISETKTYDDASAGNIYNINFMLHTPGDDESGDVDGNVKVDATIDHIDVIRDVDPDEDYQQDDMRPTEDNGEDPNPPTPPVNPDDPNKKGPEITAEAPIDLQKTNDVSGGSTVVLNVVSNAENGITGFEVDIDSEKLNAEVLEEVGLSAHLDLVSPGDLADGLSELGLPVNVGGEKDVKFDISSFMSLLTIYPGIHKFHLTVTDENGTTKATLILNAIKP